MKFDNIWQRDGQVVAFFKGEVVAQRIRGPAGWGEPTRREPAGLSLRRKYIKPMELPDTKAELVVYEAVEPIA